MSTIGLYCFLRKGRIDLQLLYLGLGIRTQLVVSGTTIGTPSSHSRSTRHCAGYTKYQNLDMRPGDTNLFANYLRKAERLEKSGYELRYSGGSHQNWERKLRQYPPCAVPSLRRTFSGGGMLLSFLDFFRQDNENKQKS